MAVERALALEGLVARVARVGPRLRVRARVHAEVGAVVERLAALRALVLPLRAVRALVVDEERVTLHPR